MSRSISFGGQISFWFYIASRPFKSFLDKQQFILLFDVQEDTSNKSKHLLIGVFCVIYHLSLPHLVVYWINLNKIKPIISKQSHYSNIWNKSISHSCVFVSVSNNINFSVGTMWQLTSVRLSYIVSF